MPKETVDFKSGIVAMMEIKSKIYEVDNGEFWPYHFPKVAATKEELNVLEKKLGYRLDGEYRAFLELTNGWPGFFQTVDLLGTNELLDSPMRTYIDEYVGEMKRLAPEWYYAEDRTVFDHALPIAATLENTDLFLIKTEKDEAPGRVIWFAGEVIDTFDSFSDCFQSMIHYNRIELESIKKRFP